MNDLAAIEPKVIGKRFIRTDGREKVTGQARYTADLTLAGMLHARLLYPEHPHARIRSIQTDKAKALPGVHAVLTQADVPNVRYGLFIKDRTLFADGVVRFEGEVVAAVAAQTAAIAKQACRLIEVDYEPLPPVLEPEAALAPDSPLVHSEWKRYEANEAVERERNECGHMTTVKGNTEAGFSQADVVVHDTFRTDMSHAVPIEPRAIVAQWQGDKVTIWSSTQVPYLARSGVAETLQIPENSVRIVVPHLGGGFGGKCGFHFEAHIAVLARVTGRPVKLVFTRREEFVATDKVRHAMIIELETGVRQDGTIVARRGRLVLDSGAYNGDALFATEIGLMMVGGPYRIPNLFAEVHTVYTNRTPAGSVRGPGGPQVCWAVEQHTDHIAEQLGMNPIEFRSRNLVTDGDTGQTGQVFEDVSAQQCLNRALELSGWGRELPEDEALGVACGWWFTAPVPSGAHLKINSDGSANIVTGAQENGSGAVMALPMLAAEELGMQPEDFNILYQDTDAAPWDLGSQGSQTTVNNGRAVVAAAREVKQQLLDLASDELEADTGDLELADGSIHVRGSPASAVTIKELAAKAQGGKLLIGRGSGAPPPLPNHNLAGCVGRLSYSVFGAPLFFCNVAHVRVDRETGVVQVLEVTAVHDIGRVLNPIGAVGQVHGGVVHAVGMALIEGTHYKDGNQLNPYLLDYKLQTMADTPKINVDFVAAPARQGGPHGAKGAGETPIVGPAGAIANAVHRAAGARVHHLPMTPSRVLTALGDLKESV